MRTVRTFGNCYASNSTARAWRLIATEPGSREEAQTYRELFRRDSQACIGENTELRVPVYLVRGAIAEGLYRRRVAVPAGLRVPLPAPGTPVRTLSDAARCFVAGAPIVRGRSSKGPRRQQPEFEALRDMAPAFFHCVPEPARNRQFDPTQIRYRLAEALLRAAPAER